jgi:hypothetical protein
LALAKICQTNIEGITITQAIILEFEKNSSREVKNMKF